MKKSMVKTLSLMLCTALLLCSIGASVYAVGSNNKEKTTTTGQAQTQTQTEETENNKISKDETVYVIAQADGTVKKVIVSDWIKNSLGKASLLDKSALTDIENLNGEETYTMNSNNLRVWDAEGNDIYYKGNIEKELPVNISITYKLDGKNISASELAGKDGRVTIRFDYKNNQYEMVEIDGKQEKIYVPFIMLTGVLLDNNTFSNVDVSNGKLISDGSRMAVIGFALPGMQSNLNVAEDIIDVPDYVEISADVKNFEMTTAVTVATNEIFNNIDPEKLDSADSLKDSLNQLTDAMNQLLDGSSQLYGGLNTLLDKSGELVAGINKLASGAEALKDGANKVNSGAASVSDGASTLSNGLDTLASKNNELNAGSVQVFNTLLSVADTQLADAGLTVPKLTIENYAQILNGIIKSLDQTTVYDQAYSTALQTVTQQVNARKDTIRAGVTEAVKQTVTQQAEAEARKSVEAEVLKQLGMTKDEYNAAVESGAVADILDSSVDAQMNSESVKSNISLNVDEMMKTENILTLIENKTVQQIDSLIKANMNSPEVQNAITQALEKAKSGAASISSLKGQLDSYNIFYTGLHAYTDGVKDAAQGGRELASGANELKGGTQTLYDGIYELCDGIFTLQNGAPELISGVTELRNGSMKLSDGLKKFNEEGIQKLTDVVNNDLGGLITRLRATVDVSEDYTSFSGISEDMNGQVKFIYRTESIEAE